MKPSKHNQNRYSILNIENLTINIKVVVSLAALLTMGVASASEFNKRFLRHANACSPEIKEAVRYKSYPNEAYDQFLWAKHPEVKGLKFGQMPSSKRDQYLDEWYASQPAIDRCKEKPRV
jgi:hypothetical protein